MPEIDGNATAKAGAPSEAIIDRAHLARMILGDKRLEVEVLNLFERQADLLLERMRGAPPPAVAAFAHTLEGCARGVGVWKVAAAARAVELAARNCVPAALSDSIGQTRGRCRRGQGSRRRAGACVGSDAGHTTVMPCIDRPRRVSCRIVCR